MSSSSLRNPIPPPAVQLGQDGSPIAPVPIVPDVITRLDATRNVEQNSGENTIIDVQPDFRFPLASWIYSLCHSVQGSAFASHPLASPASVLAYTQAMFIGLLFYNDAFLRFSPSSHALKILNDSTFRVFFDLLLDLSVPAFAHAEFSSLMTHQDELAKSLFYFGTLAGSFFYKDFGRFPPLTCFTTLHNLLATLPQRSSAADLFAAYYTSVSAEITLPGNNNNVDLTPAHYFGHYYRDSANATQRHDNWLNTFVDQFLTANAIRVVNATATVTRLAMRLPARTGPDNYNPYLYGTGLHFDTLSPLIELVRNMNDFVRLTWPASRPLRAYTQFGTQEIARHLSFECGLPTWHNQATPTKANLLAEDANGNPAAFKQAVAPADFAAFIQYLAPRPAPAAGTTPASVTLTQGVQAENDTGLLVQLVMSATGAPASDPAGIRSFDSHRHTNPRFIIFDPSSDSTAHLSSAITSGKIIENNDISAVGIPVPTPLRPLSSTNSEYILGAINMAQIQNGITGTPWTVRRRNWNTNYRAPQIFWKSVPSQLILPVFRKGLVRPATTSSGTPNVDASHYLPGARFISHAYHAHDGINAFASELGTPSNTVPDEFHQLWSSYRFYDVESRTWYMLPTLRHIYGVRARCFISDSVAVRLH